MNLESGLLTIAFEQDKQFKVKMIEGQLSAVEEAASKQFARDVKVELALGNRGQASAVKEEIRRKVAPTTREELTKACSTDADLDKLVDTLDGEPLHEKDRDNWK